jgi:putative hemolysin
MISTILIIIIIISIFIAGVFSGSETGIYQMNLLRLRLGIERKKLSFILLGKLFDDSPSLLISTLIGTNLAQYIVTSVITYLFLSRFASVHTAELFATITTTPLLFIFADLIPKNLFFHRSDQLMPYVSYILYAVNKIFNWLQVVPVIRYILKLFAGSAASAPFLKAHTNAIRFPYLKSLIYDIESQNILSPVQTAIINRLSQIGNLTIVSVMTPFSKVQMLDVNSDAAQLFSSMQNHQFSHWPVFDKSRENIIGFINIYHFLNAESTAANLKDFIRPLSRLNAETTITEAVNIMRGSNQKIALVVKKGYANVEKPLGIVSIKDLAEELVGELAEW